MNTQIVTNPIIIVAIDVPTRKEAFNLGRNLDPRICRVKIGKELFTATGPAVVEDFMKRGFDVFLDLKYHDIHNTVAGAIRSACGLGVWMVNMHCLGGPKMMEAAVEAVKGASNPPKLIGVTILTSMDEDDLITVGIGTPGIPNLDIEVMRLAKLAQAGGLDGIVCSGKEVKKLRASLGEGFILVTPGIRLPTGNKDDQARIVTPEKAMQDGASYLVIGRPITGAVDPLVALQDFNQRTLAESYA